MPDETTDTTTTTATDGTTTTDTAPAAKETPIPAELTAAFERAGLPTEKPQGTDDAGDASAQDETKDDATSAETTDATASESSDYTEQQLQAAKSLGYSKDRLDSIRPELKDDFKAMLDDHAKRHAKVMGRLGNLEKQLKDKASGKAEDPPAKDAAETSADEDLTFTEDDLGDTNALLEKFNRLAAEPKKLRQQLAEMTQRAQASAESSAHREVDTWFASKLPADLREKYGDKPVAEYGDDAPEVEARQELLDQAEVQMQVAKQLGRPMSRVEALDAALLLLERDTILKSAERQGKAARMAGSKVPHTQARRSAPVAPGTSKAVLEMRKAAEAGGIVLPP